MYQIEIFQPPIRGDTYNPRLSAADGANEWLQEMDDKIEIVSVQTSILPKDYENERRHCVVLTILYRLL